jgi:acetyl esterase/lipase
MYSAAGYFARANRLIVFCTSLACSASALAQPPIDIPETVHVERDINYAGTDNPRQTLDVLTPKKPNGDKPLPVIVNIHGGAFAFGDKNSGVEEIIPLIADGNYVGVSINYRLTGEAIWPAQIHDCKAAIRWVRANAQKYNIDPERIGVIGASAGGHLVAMLGFTANDADLEGDIGAHRDTSSAVQCVIDEFGPVDLVALPTDGSQMDHNAADSPEGRLLGGEAKLKQDVAKAASPVTYISKDDAPILILHGSEDPLIPLVQSERLYKSLRESGVEAYFVTVQGAGHGGFRNPEIAKRRSQFFDNQLRGQDEEISEEAIAN